MYFLEKKLFQGIKNLADVCVSVVGFKFILIYVSEPRCDWLIVIRMFEKKDIEYESVQIGSRHGKRTMRG
jgi:hypothetical protein